MAHRNSRTPKQFQASGGESWGYREEDHWDVYVKPKDLAIIVNVKIPIWKDRGVK